MALVLDASIVLAWCFRDEATAKTDRLLDLAIAGEQLHVPAHWPIEVLNGATRAARRGRLDDGAVETFLKSVTTMDIAVDRQTLSEQWDRTRPLITRHRLSAYDAAYLDLAQRLGLKLATRDAQLYLAAKVEGLCLVALMHH